MENIGPRYLIYDFLVMYGNRREGFFDERSARAFANQMYKTPGTGLISLYKYDDSGNRYKLIKEVDNTKKGAWM